MTEVQHRFVAATCPGQSWLQHDVDSPNLTPFIVFAAPKTEHDQAPCSPRCLDFQQPPADAYMRLGALEAKISHNHETRDLRTSLSTPVLGSRVSRRASYSANPARNTADRNMADAPLPAVLDKRNLTNEELLIEVENSKKRLQWLRRVSYLNASDRYAADYADEDGDGEAAAVAGGDADMPPANPYLQMPSRHMSISEGELDTRVLDSAQLADNLAMRYNRFKKESHTLAADGARHARHAQHADRERAGHDRQSNLQRSVTLDRATIKPRAAKKKRSLLQRMIRKINPRTSK